MEVIISGLPRVAFNSGGRLDIGVTGSGSYGLVRSERTGVKVTGTQLRIGYGVGNKGFFTLNAGTEASWIQRVTVGEYCGLNGLAH